MAVITQQIITRFLDVSGNFLSPNELRPLCQLTALSQLESEIGSVQDSGWLKVFSLFCL